MKTKRILLTLLLMTSMLIGSVGEVYATNEYLTWGPGAVGKSSYVADNVSIYTVTTTTDVKLKLLKPIGYQFIFYVYLDGYPNNQIANFNIDDYDATVFYYNSLPARTPDTYRKVSLKIYGIHVNGYGGVSGSLSGSQEIILNTYTDAHIPIGVSFPTIGTTSVKLTWNNQSNPSDTSYTLQRSLDGTNWTNVTTQAGMYEYTDAGLTQNTKYYYRIRVNEKRGTYKYSSTSWIETATDPAVAAAKAAQSAAESTKVFAEEAKNAAINAEAKATEAVDLINGLDTKFTAQLTNIQNQMLPTVLSVKSTSGATATTTGSINIIATAINSTWYRTKINNGSYSAWQPSPFINVDSLVSGVNVIEVQATNSLVEGSPTSSGYITVFSLL